MIFCELHALAAQELRANLGRDRRAKLIVIDGFTGLNAYVPPIERRGLALIDPPYEVRDDFERGLQSLESAWRKWSTGIFCLWYPVKDQNYVAACLRQLADGKIKRVLRLELHIAEPTAAGPLVANGLLIVNPPFGLAEEAQTILRFLVETLAETPGATFKIEWLTGE
jgi:23S rRNA (adenine2030-N6)-methyltransferase